MGNYELKNTDKGCMKLWQMKDDSTKKDYNNLVFSGEKDLIFFIDLMKMIVIDFTFNTKSPQTFDPCLWHSVISITVSCYGVLRELNSFTSKKEDCG